MGYYTNFAIQIRTYVTKEVAKSIVDSINNQIGFKAFSLYEPSNVNDTDKTSWDLEPGDEMKWYEWESDMDKIARKYPNIEFRIEGRGEDKEDWWVGLFKGERNQITYAEPPSDRWID